MNDNYNYPVGADNIHAPWNQPADTKEIEFDVTCSQTLSKTSTVFTNDYIATSEKEWDGEMWFNDVDIDTSNTNWEEEYHGNDHYTPIQLIELFQKFLLDEVNGSNTVNRSTKYLNHLITECNNWVEDETEYFEE